MIPCILTDIPHRQIEGEIADVHGRELVIDVGAVRFRIHHLKGIQSGLVKRKMGDRMVRNLSPISILLPLPPNTYKKAHHHDPQTNNPAHPIPNLHIRRPRNLVHRHLHAHQNLHLQPLLHHRRVRRVPFPLLHCILQPNSIPHPHAGVCLYS